MDALKRLQAEIATGGKPEIAMRTDAALLPSSRSFDEIGNHAERLLNF